MARTGNITQTLDSEMDCSDSLEDAYRPPACLHCKKELQIDIDIKEDIPWWFGYFCCTDCAEQYYGGYS